MLSALSNPNMPPLMSPESQSPGLFSLGKAKLGEMGQNFQQNMSDPKKQVAQTMLMNSIKQMGQGFFGAPQMQRRPSQFDMNGNPIG